MPNRYTIILTRRSQVDKQLPDASHFRQTLDRSVLHLTPSGEKLGFEYDFDGSMVALQQVEICYLWLT